MRLIPDDPRAKPLANGGSRREIDHPPAVQLLDRSGAATRLITEMMPAGPDIRFGLCDLGFDCPELGYVSLSERKAANGRLGLGIERDLYLEARFPRSVSAEAARRLGRITETGRLLADAAHALGHKPIPPSPELPPESRAKTPRLWREPSPACLSR